jgi:hypothetical protein
MEHTLILQPVDEQPLPVLVNNNEVQVEESTLSEVVSSDKPFIQANTIEVDVEELSKTHIIPVFIKDNEPLISHADFIEATTEVVADIFHGERILKPAIRVSHPIKGRIPEARNKAANELEDWEKTIYYERMAFVIEIPTISEVIGGNKLSLTVGGIKAYNLDNLYSRKGSDEHFMIFVGFENKVCLNLCLWSDGTMLDVRVKNIGQLMSCIRSLIQQYNQQHHLFHLKEFCNYALTEQQFATLIGRCRMYNHLPSVQRNQVPPLMFGDTQIGLVCKDFYKDKSFCRDNDGNINLWRLYNLFTSANKTTYIDSFAERSSNAFDFTFNLKHALQSNTHNWYLS